jgi:hypothetical protein
MALNDYHLLKFNFGNTSMIKLSEFSVFVIIFILISEDVNSQVTNIYQKGLSAEQNLNAIRDLTPYSTGAMGFDTRYQGIKGSPRLFDTLLPSFLNVKGQDYYLQLRTDIDLVQNTLLFIHPKTGKMLALPSDMVNEVVIKSDGKEMVFRTTKGKSFEKDINEQKFFQVLNEGAFPFIKVPFITFTEANYKGAYSPDRRYDEYETKYRYNIFGPDDIFHEVQLNRKSLIRLFPDKKEIIDNVIRSKTYKNDEEMVIVILEKME